MFSQPVTQQMFINISVCLWPENKVLYILLGDMYPPCNPLHAYPLQLLPHCKSPASTSGLLVPNRHTLRMHFFRHYA